jgi:hypothetical protein
MPKKDATASKAAEDKEVYGDLSSDDGEPAASSKKIPGKQKPKAGGIKWSIVFLLSLFVLPGLFGAVSYVYDMIYPEVRKAV